MKIVSICALAVVAAVALASPASAQDWAHFYPEADERRADMLVQVLDPEVPRGERGRYVNMTLGDLLAGVHTFPDTLARYVAVKAASSRPTFTAADLMAGSSSPGLLTAAGVPPLPAGESGVWVAAAVPVHRPLSYAAIGVAGRRTDRTGAFVPQGSTVTLDGVEYSVWVANETVSLLLEGQFVFFDRAAVPQGGEQ